jgi:glutathione peroxidase
MLPLTSSFLTLALAAAGDAVPGGAVAPDSFYSLKTTTLQGQPADLTQFAGRVTLVVNVASECGYTPQYAGLQKLHDDLQARGFSVLGFPSNEFGQQEPGSADQIQAFCKKNYGVTFPMFSKLVTRAGPDQSPIYSYLGKSGQLPNWNFCKYVVGRDGHVVAFYPSKVAPEAKELREAIEAALSN